MSIDDVTARLAVSRGTVRKLVREGRLPAIQIVPGGRLKFRSEDVEALCRPNVGVTA